jgi:hypothetical protein
MDTPLEQYSAHTSPPAAATPQLQKFARAAADIDYNYNCITYKRILVAVLFYNSRASSHAQIRRRLIPRLYFRRRRRPPRTVDADCFSRLILP